jgi:hypothetical protein
MLETYWKDLCDRVGFTQKDDPTTLSDEQLVTLGRTLAEEYHFVAGGISDKRKFEQAKILQDMKKLMNEEEYRHFEEDIHNGMMDKIENTGYILVHGSIQKGKRKDFIAEFHYQLSQLNDEINNFCYEGELKKLTDAYLDLAKRCLHYWLNHEGELAVWVSSLRTEFRKRKGIPEPKMNIIEWDGDDEDFEEPDIPDDQIIIWQLEDTIQDWMMTSQAKDILYERLERIALSNDEDKQEQILALREEQRTLNNDNYQNRSNWRPNDKENIRLLTQIAKPEGHWVKLNFPENEHFSRGLCLRYGINLTKRTQCQFHVKRLAWANNYWGILKGFEDKGEVLISMRINTQNKADGELTDIESDDAYDYFYDAKTTLVGRQHGDKYLELEIKHAPLGADHRGYEPEDLLKANKLIMAELMK